jgi:hypothetical protein
MKVLFSNGLDVAMTAAELSCWPAVGQKFWFVTPRPLKEPDRLRHDWNSRKRAKQSVLNWSRIDWCFSTKMIVKHYFCLIWKNFHCWRGIYCRLLPDPYHLFGPLHQG